ncbi:MAG TPA: hypothetical protein VHE35_16500 [Kofleriaceae bacterium]|nr:hypothetical protein [Kofleriaceae bacterium]
MLAQAGTTFEAHPWAKARTDANTQNPGKVPNSVKKNFKWKWPHRNNAEHLPGVPGAGGYDEYDIMNATNDGPADYERLVLSTTTSDVFHKK